MFSVISVERTLHILTCAIFIQLYYVLFTVPIFWMRTQRHRELSYLTQGYTAAK